MKKIVSILTSIMLCAALFVTPVFAAEQVPANVSGDITISPDASVYASNWWSKTTVKLNSVYGASSTVSSVSSGSVSGSNPQVSSVELYCNVSSGSDSFTLYVEDPYGDIYYTTVSKTGTITTNAFNGINPYGQWKIWIVTNGTVSTVTVTIKCYYTY